MQCVGQPPSAGVHSGGPLCHTSLYDSSIKSSLREIYNRLFHSYGPQHWWPARTKTEVVVGAILTQNTAWSNVERAIQNLKRAKVLTWSALRDLPATELAELIRPSGTYEVKAKRLGSFVRYLWEDHNGSLRSMLNGDMETARERLLSIHGIGPETADAILLYAGNHPTFVVDAYTRRILRRHYLCDHRMSYEKVRELFHSALSPKTRLFNEYHALFVTVGKRHCRSRARCLGCPLEGMVHDPAL